MHARGHVELVVEITAAGDHPAVLVAGGEFPMPHARKSLLVADAKDRLHALVDNELLFDALKDQDDVVVRGGADVHDGWEVHQLALSSARGVRWMSQQHVVAVPLKEHLPEGIELSTTRFRFVRGEDAVYGAEGGFVLVLPQTCDEEAHLIMPWCLSASHILQTRQKRT